MWPARLYRIVPHCLINGTTFGGGGEVEHKMCVLIFLLNPEGAVILTLGVRSAVG
jgi:hypothetical protein